MNDKVWVFPSSKEFSDRFTKQLSTAGIEGRFFSSIDALTSEAGVDSVMPVFVHLSGEKDNAWKEAGVSLAGKWGKNGYLILAARNPTPETIVEALELGYRGIVLLKDDVPEDVFSAQLKKQVKRAANHIKRNAAIRKLNDIVDGFVSEIARISKLERQESDEGPVHIEKARVLVVDSDTTRQGEPIFKELCNHPAVSARRVATAGEALSMTRQEPYDIFIVDNELSDCNAIDFIKELSEECPGAESIFVVGFTAADSAVDALRWGAASFLLKPFSAEDLIAHVEELIKRVAGRKKTRRVLRDFSEAFKEVWEKTQ